ncbi:MAG: hypothetical protein M1835_004336 [Candelina submexicana]|nr:MAG: hypothetical protein M1835_004336 [Candelina submexicana]
MADPSGHVLRAPIEQGFTGPLKSAEQKLRDFLPAPGVSSQVQYNDSDLVQIASLLRGINFPSWATAPRTYTVLRTIGRLQLLDGFIDQGISDIWFPFTSSTLPPTLKPSMHGKFLELQPIVLTKSYNLENDERRHVNFGQNEPLPFEIQGKLGRGGYGAVDKNPKLAEPSRICAEDLQKARRFEERGYSDF